MLQVDIYEKDFKEERKDREAKHSQLEDVKERSTREIGRLQNTIRDLEKKQLSQLTQSYEYGRLRRGTRKSSGRISFSKSSDMLDHRQKEVVGQCTEVIDL